MEDEWDGTGTEKFQDERKKHHQERTSPSLQHQKLNHSSRIPARLGFLFKYNDQFWPIFDSASQFASFFQLGVFVQRDPKSTWTLYLPKRTFHAQINICATLSKRIVDFFSLYFVLLFVRSLFNKVSYFKSTFEFEFLSTSLQCHFQVNKKIWFYMITNLFTESAMFQT